MKEGFLSLDIIKQTAAFIKGKQLDEYYFVIPAFQSEDILRGLTPKEAWKLAYRHARLAVKKKPIPKITDAIGRYEGFRFITSK